jgi:hypothetical protein
LGVERTHSSFVSLASEVLKEGDWLRALLAEKEGRVGALVEAFSAGKEQV